MTLIKNVGIPVENPYLSGQCTASRALLQMPRGLLALQGIALVPQNIEFQYVLIDVSHDISMSWQSECGAEITLCCFAFMMPRSPPKIAILHTRLRRSLVTRSSVRRARYSSRDRCDPKYDSFVSAGSSFPRRVKSDRESPS